MANKATKPAQQTKTNNAKKETSAKIDLTRSYNGLATASFSNVITITQPKTVKKAAKKAAQEQTSILTIKQDTFDSIQNEKVSKVFAKIKADPGSTIQIDDQLYSIPEQGYGYLDITDKYINANNQDINIPFKTYIDSKNATHTKEKIQELVSRPTLEVNLPNLFDSRLNDLGMNGKTTLPRFTPPILIDPPRSSTNPSKNNEDIVVEYFVDDESIPANETYSLAGGVEANVLLAMSLNLPRFHFDDITLNNTTLPFKISHTHTFNNGAFGCGKLWRTNLHQKLEKKISKEKETKFTYFDENGYSHSFKETFYYFNDQGKKVTIKKGDVSINAIDGTQYYETSGKKYEVFLDQRTTCGLSLTTRLEGFKNIDYYEQRQKEEKQLEDTIYSYKKTLKDYVIVNSDTGETTGELKKYFKTENDILTTENFDQFTNDLKKGLLFQKQDAIQYQSLCTQQKIIKKQIKESQQTVNSTTTSLILEKNSLYNQHNSLYNSALELESQVRKSTVYDTSLVMRQLCILYNQFKLIGHGIPDTFGGYYYVNKDSISYMPPSQRNSDTFKKATKYNFESNPFGYTISGINNNVNQIKINESQTATNNAQFNALLPASGDGSLRLQEKMLDEQTRFYYNQNATRKEELQRIYKEYINYEYSLARLMQTMPTATLTDGNKSLCFNDYGDLCGISDSHNHYWAIERDLNNNISSITDSKKTIIFRYYPYGLLESITDFNGKKVEYTYSSNNIDADLKKVKLANGDTIEFEYSNSFITSVYSTLEKVKTKIKYINEKVAVPSLESIANFSMVSKITDTGETSIKEAEAEKNYTFSTISFNSKAYDTTITNDGKQKRYFMDNKWIFTGGYAQNDDNTLGGFSYVHVNRDNPQKIKTFSIHEIDDAVVSIEKKNSTTVQGTKLPINCKEYMFSVIISGPESGNILTKIKAGTFMGPRATVTYTDKSTAVFQTPAIYRGFGSQICAVPISLSLDKEVSKIELSLTNTTDLTASCDLLRLAPAECKYETFDEFKKIISSESSKDFVCYNKKDKTTLYRQTSAKYTYNERQQLIKKETTNKDFTGTATSSFKLITKYAYNSNGAQIREETFVEGKEATRGIIVNENVYDDKGRIVKNSVYNTLESSNKKHNEKIYNDNDETVQSEIDALGVNKISYEYDSTNNIASITYPSGSKLSYSRDCNTNAITAISQSTEDGEPNSIETHYNCGLVTKLKSNTNTIDYEYNGKREKTAVYFNGIKKVDYSYEKDVKIGNTLTEKTKATLWSGSNEKIDTETFVDSKKNIIQTNLNGKTLFKNTFSKTKVLLSSEDCVTQTTTNTTYDDINHRIDSISRSKSRDEKYSYLKPLKESFEYDSFGQKKTHTISVGDTTSQYKFEYNENDPARSLKAIRLPNRLTSIHQKDFLGRTISKTLQKENGENILGEYITFRKVGDHSSDTVSSIRYGEICNGKYSIIEGVHYKYDSTGNITETWTNGKFTAAYSYDHLNRIIREDNAIFQKTWLYTYDGNGNRTTKTEIPFTRQKTDEITDISNATVENYAYDGDMLTSRNGDGFTYDGFGNPTKFKNKNLQWENGKLIAFESHKFDYDGYGKRIRKDSTYYTYDTNKNLVEMENGDNTLRFIYDNSGISGIEYNDQQYLLRKNVQGDITHIFSIDGTMVAQYVYDAWGNHKVLDANGKIIDEQEHIGNTNPFRYRGYFYDTETKLYYLINRYYDPEIGRFISQDQISYMQPDVINGLNLFAYCGNNPVMRIDENGCSWKSFWRGVGDFFKKVGDFFVKAGLFIAGLTIASIGLATVLPMVIPLLATPITAITSIVSAQLIPNILIPGKATGNTILGFLTQLGMSVGIYGIDMMRAAFDKDVYNDMKNINWNPFNSDAEKVLNCSKVSFFKGLPVTKDLPLSTGRSFFLGAIVLDKDENEINTIYHEYGHSLQFAVLGPINYLISVGIPSAGSWNKTNYYGNPWENIANEYGGNIIFNNSEGQRIEINHNRNVLFLMLNHYLGAWSLIASAAVK